MIRLSEELNYKIKGMYSEPVIDVGIICEDSIEFKLNGNFSYGDRKLAEGSYKAFTESGTIIIYESEHRFMHQENILIEPSADHVSSYFELQNVTIGVGFHWE